MFSHSGQGPPEKLCLSNTTFLKPTSAAETHCTHPSLRSWGTGLFLVNTHSASHQPAQCSETTHVLTEARFKGMKPNHKNGPSQIKTLSRTGVGPPGVGPPSVSLGVVCPEPCTCLNNLSITPETSEGTPHRGGNKGPDPGVKRVTREARRIH